MDFFNLPKSKVIKSFQFTGERIPYPDPKITGDTYPMTWGADDKIYASAGDPLWGESRSGLDVETFNGGPLDYEIKKFNNMNDFLGWGGAGAKPSGMISVDGLIYLAAQNLRGGMKPPHSNYSQPGSDAHILFCNPEWNQWFPSYANIKELMFPGSRFGGPSFINFGKDNENARDGYVYAISGDQWDNGSNVRLGRVPKGNICDRMCWEFVSAFDRDGNPAWNISLDEAIPILSIHRFIGLPEMVYLKSINRYLFLTWHLRGDFNPREGTDLLVLEAPEPWGPFSFVHLEELWEGKAYTPYCPRVPLKWMDEDGLGGYLQFSGSWAPEAQAAGYYRSNLRQFRLEV